MKLNYEFILRNIAGENILVPVGEAAKKFNGLFAMTEVAAFIWGKLPEAEEEGELVRAVTDSFDVDEATARADTAEFLDKLRGMGII